MKKEYILALVVLKSSAVQLQMLNSATNYVTEAVTTAQSFIQEQSPRIVELGQTTYALGKRAIEVVPGYYEQAQSNLANGYENTKNIFEQIKDNSKEISLALGCLGYASFLGRINPLVSLFTYFGNKKVDVEFQTRLEGLNVPYLGDVVKFRNEISFGCRALSALQWGTLAVGGVNFGMMYLGLAALAYGLEKSVN